MAKLTKLPSVAIIDGFKGVIDFYVNYQSRDRSVSGPGIPCARSWPYTPLANRSPGEQVSWPAFTEAAQLWTQLSPEIQDAYNKLATGTALAGRDMFTRSYISGLYRYPH